MSLNTNKIKCLSCSEPACLIPVLRSISLRLRSMESEHKLKAKIPHCPPILLTQGICSPRVSVLNQRQPLSPYYRSATHYVGTHAE